MPRISKSLIILPTLKSSMSLHSRKNQANGQGLDQLLLTTLDRRKLGKNRVLSRPLNTSFLIILKANIFTRTLASEEGIVFNPCSNITKGKSHNRPTIRRWKRLKRVSISQKSSNTRNMMRLFPGSRARTCLWSSHPRLRSLPR